VWEREVRRERERDGERESERERERGKEGESDSFRDGVSVCTNVGCTEHVRESIRDVTAT
jgi:hypothetical protein